LEIDVYHVLARTTLPECLRRGSPDFLHDSEYINLDADRRIRPFRLRSLSPASLNLRCAIEQELLLALRPLVQGIYLIPSFGRYEVAAEVLDVLEREAVGA
jgi:hypothetical protein